MSEIKHTPGPVTVITKDKWPFKIQGVDANGEVLWEEHRYAFSSEMKTLKDLHSGVGFKGSERQEVIEKNRRQLLDCYRRGAGADMYEAAFGAVSRAIPVEIVAQYPDGYSKYTAILRDDLDALKAVLSKARGES